MKWMRASKMCHMKRKRVDFLAFGPRAHVERPYAAKMRTNTRERETRVVGSVSISPTVKGGFGTTNWAAMGVSMANEGEVPKRRSCERE